MLTRKQFELLKFIQARLATDGVSPSFDEMKEALNLKSKSGIHRLITALEERGFIRRLAHRARALEVVKLPEDAAAGIKPKPRFTPTVYEGGATPASRFAPPLATPDVEHRNRIPLLGRIAAGLPIEAIENAEQHLEVPTALLGKGDHFALVITGESMVDAGISDGDWAILRKTDTAQNGEIVVALVDDSEATLKRFRRVKGSIALEPANREFKTQIYGPDRVQVQGKLVGLIRRFD